ncbi:MAG: DUF1015 domain-containing protein [Actinobacteria bacterium]|nr:DUF1015 domain-containing protein [Actinomycetota bacterium]
MANSRAFRAIRYAPGTDFSLVAGPPYDVISTELRAELEGRHPANIIHLTLGPRLPEETDDRYRDSGERFRSWLAEGVLVREDQPSVFLYRFDPPDRPPSAAIICALELERLGEGDVLPHERTMPVPKADRLALMRTTQANLEPLWFVASRPLGIVSKAVDAVAGIQPEADVTGMENVRHRLWRLPKELMHITEDAIGDAKLVIADGHHRYETAIAYRDERTAAEGPGPWDFTLAMIQDPIDFGPILRPIHRVVSGYPVERVIEKSRASRFSGTLQDLPTRVASVGSGTIGVASGNGLWTIATDADLDTLWLAEMLEGSDAKVSYEHDLGQLENAISREEVVFVLAPIAIEKVTEMAISGERMPPKTTLFWPKPLSGLVMRDLANRGGDLG